MKTDRIISLLGLAERARKVASGEFAVEKAVKSGTAYLVIVAVDSSELTKKNFTDMCEYYQVPLVMYATKEELGHGLGKIMRASVAVLDEGFAKAIEKVMKTEHSMM